MKKLVIKRLHDDFYKNEKRYAKPKQSFTKLFEILKFQKNKSILDIGSANGELLYNLNKNYKSCELTGYELLPKLISTARKNLPYSIEIKKIDITKKINISKKFDIIIVSGVISIFDNYEKPLKNLLKILNPKGQIYIFNHFNKYPIDVFIKYRTLKKNKHILQSGWNVHSIEGLKKFFSKNKKKCKVFKFMPKNNFLGNKKDPIRSWTFKNSKNEHLITNGLSILQDQYWLKFY